jgi:hypothetical protein
MYRSTFDPQDAPGNSPAETLRAAERKSAQEVERWPTPGELFFEAGIVLAVALGAGVVIQLVMGGV